MKSILFCFALTKEFVTFTGATVVSWRVNNQEQLFVSKQAQFDGKKAIRGGIPFVFRKILKIFWLFPFDFYLCFVPMLFSCFSIQIAQFGAWNYGPQHGFARISRWSLEKSPERLHSGDVEAVFSLMDSDFSRSMWNFPFRITYR